MYWKITVPAGNFISEKHALKEVCDAFPVSGEPTVEKEGDDYVLTVPSDIEDAAEIERKLVDKGIGKATVEEA